MTVKELKKTEGYIFQCDIARKRVLKEIADTDYFDEWGCAFISVGEELGVEYNLCIDNTTDENINSSGIYKVDYNEENDYIETDYDTSVSYEIDFDNHKWKTELENAMCEALIEFFEL